MHITELIICERSHKKKCRVYIYAHLVCEGGVGEIATGGMDKTLQICMNRRVSCKKIVGSLDILKK